MQTCIATVSVSGTLQEKIVAIADAGFSCLELFEPDLLASGEEPEVVGRMVRDHGLSLALLQPLRDFEGLPISGHVAALDIAEQKFDLMAQLGTDLLLVCSSVAEEASGDMDRISNDIALLGGRAAQRNLRVGYEALSWARHIRTHEQAWEVVRRSAAENVGLILDSFQTLAGGTDTASLETVPGNRIFHVQLADAPLSAGNLLQVSRGHRVLPGEGELDLHRFMRAIEATNYSGPISIEIFRQPGQPYPSAGECFQSLRKLLD